VFPGAFEDEVLSGQIALAPEQLVHDRRVDNAAFRGHQLLGAEVARQAHAYAAFAECAKQSEPDAVEPRRAQFQNDGVGTGAVSAAEQNAPEVRRRIGHGSPVARPVRAPG